MLCDELGLFSWFCGTEWRNYSKDDTRRRNCTDFPGFAARFQHKFARERECL